jgi:hypothetical protein
MEDCAAQWQAFIVGITEQVAKVLDVSVYVHMVFVQKMAYHGSRHFVVFALRRRVQSRAQRGVSSSGNEMIKQIDISVCCNPVE